MSERLDIYNSMIERDKTYQEEALRESAAASQAYKDFSDDIISKKERFQENSKAYNNFLISVKEMLLVEALTNIASSGLESINEASEIILKNLSSNFINDKGVENVFLCMPKTYILEYTKNLIDVYTKIITEKADKENKDSFKVDTEDKMAFLDELNSEADIENVKQAIALRVSNAEEEFITANINDKIEMDNIIKDTKERIDSVKQDNTIDDEVREGISQETANISKQRIDFLRENTDRSIFNQMVLNLSESIIKDKELMLEFTDDNNKLKIDKIVETARCFYSFLEAINTIKLVKVNEEYVEEVLNDMK